jgi:Preprotein translocase SecG subunit
MLQVSAIFQVIVSVALLALILMHSGRDAGLGGMGFTPASQGGTHIVERNLTSPGCDARSEARTQGAPIAVAIGATEDAASGRAARPGGSADISLNRPGATLFVLALVAELVDAQG